MKEKESLAKSKHTTVSIPQPLFKKTKELIKGTGFTSVSDFTTFVLREIVINTGENEGKKEDKRALIKEKLKGLGYL